MRADVEFYSFLTSVADWDARLRTRPGRFTPLEREPVPIVHEAEWAPGLVGT